MKKLNSAVVWKGDGLRAEGFLLKKVNQDTNVGLYGTLVAFVSPHSPTLAECELVFGVQYRVKHRISSHREQYDIVAEDILLEVPTTKHSKLMEAKQNIKKRLPDILANTLHAFMNEVFNPTSSDYQNCTATINLSDILKEVALDTLGIPKEEGKC